MNWAIVVYIVFALLPGLHAWYSGRRLIQKLDDPALAELKLTRSQHQAQVFSAAWIVLLLLAPGLVLLSLAITSLGSLAGGFPLRKKLLGERWGFFSYLRHTALVFLAFGGTWILIASVLAILYRAEDYLLLATLLLGLLVAGLFLATSWLVPRLLNGKALGPNELAEDHLAEPFEKILSNAQCPQPRFVSLPWGGRVTNAFALSSAGPRGTVAFTQGLLETLNPNQTAAILAHELAHLEHTDRRKMLFSAVRLALLVVIAATVVWFVPSETGFQPSLSLIWAFVVILALSLTIVARRKHERASDLRALELGAAPEDLIDALTLLHQRLVIPRQLDEQMERSSSHPSLARRIQAIRHAAYGDEATARDEAKKENTFEPVLVRHGGDAVLFEGDRLSWLSGLPEGPLGSHPRDEARTVSASSYGELRSLLLVSRHRGTTLRCVEESGKKCNLPVAAEEVKRVQSALQRVDHRLGGVDTEGALFSPPAHSPLRRVVASLGAILGLIPTVPWAVFLGSLLVLIRPSPATLMAATVTALGGTVFVLQQQAFWGSAEGALVLGLALVLFSLLYFVFLFPTLRTPPPRSQKVPGLRLTTWVLGTTAALCTLGLVSSFFTPLVKTGLHQWARSTPSFPVALAALGAVCLFIPGGRRRSLALIALLGAGASIFLASSTFEARWTEDSFRHRGPALVAEEILLQPERHRVLPGDHMALFLSPGGKRIGIQSSHGDSAHTFQVEQQDGSFEELQALAMEFVDEDHLLSLQDEDGELILRLLPAEGLSLEKLWSLPVERLSLNHLRVLGNRWQIVGSRHLQDGDSNRRIVCLSGTVGAEQVRREEWSFPTSEIPSSPSWWAGSELGVVSLGFQIPDLSSMSGWLRMAAFSQMTTQLRWWRDTDSATSESYATTKTVFVKTPSPGDDAFYWLVPEDFETVVWRLVPGQEPQALGWLPGYAHSLGETGDRGLLLESYTHPSIFDPETKRVSRLTLTEAKTHEEEGFQEFRVPSGDAFAVHGSHVATATTDWDAQVTTVQVYRMTEAGGG